MNTQILLEIGLSEREVAVYVALLKIGVTTTGRLVKESGVPNSKIYEVLEKLIEKGLVSYSFKGKVKHFQASSPKALFDFINNKKDRLQETVKDLEKLRKKEISDYKNSTYEGIKAIKAAFFELYEHVGKNGEYCVFPIGEELGTEELIQFWAEVFHKRTALNIKIRALPNTRLKRIIEKHYSTYKNIRVKYTSSVFPTGIFIFRDYVMNVVWGEKPVAFVVKSKENYEKWQQFFEEQWRESK